MEDREIAENIKYARELERKYGYSIVPAATVYEAFSRRSRLADSGFSEIKRGTYCKAINEDITHVVKLQALKGASYAAWWGVSLAYVPHGWTTKVRWHRTIKSAQLDLREEFRDPIKRKSLSDVRFISTLHGERFLAETLEAMWSHATIELTPWLDRAVDLKGVAAIAHEQSVSDDWAYRTHYPNPRLVYAFTLARTGYRADAERELKAYFDQDREDPQAKLRLEAALLEVLR